MGYDPLDRLTSHSTPTRVSTWQYDGVGNRTRQQVGTGITPYRYASDSNRLIEVNGTPIHSNATGHITQDQQVQYQYDARERLVQATRAGVSSSYTLNALGQRVSKTVAGGTPAALAQTITQRIQSREDCDGDGRWNPAQGMSCIHAARQTGKPSQPGKPTSASQIHFVYDEQGQLLGEYDATGQPIQEYVYLGSTPVAIVKPNAQEPSKPHIYHLHADHLGTPRQVTDPASNKVIWRWDSDAFGTTPASEDPDGDGLTFTLNLRFPGQYFDKETGLHYNYFRDYHPATGRYVQSDPIGLRGGVNTYGYVGGDPVKWVDPFGHDFRANVVDGGGRGGPTYGGTMTVVGANGQTVTVPVSSWPNPNNPSPGVASGDYTGRYCDACHKINSPNATNGIRVNDGAPVPTNGPNPQNGGQPSAVGINIHCGASATNRGSAGCVTIKPGYCDQVWSVLQQNETGTVTIIRPPPPALFMNP